MSNSPEIISDTGLVEENIDDVEEGKESEKKEEF